MIVSLRNDQPPQLFEKVLESSKVLMYKKSKADPDYFMGKDDAEFEVDVCEHMRSAAKGTSFEGNIDLVSGHSFPDIIARNSVYGVEVKKTNKNHWSSTGNSVLESTRLKDVKKIYIFFGKLANPIDFKYRLYQECLQDIAVTHSPRYRIDMDLKPTETIFSRMGVSYDDLRTKDDPLRYFVDYYRKIRKGSEPWWISKSEDEAITPMITLWSALKKAEQDDLQTQIMAIFPEVFGTANSKYNRVVLWLAKRHSVINASLRDEFTAGGQMSIAVGKTTHKGVPKVFYHLNSKIKRIFTFLKQAADSHIQELRYYWEDNTITPENVINEWRKRVIFYAMKHKEVSGDLIKGILHVK